MAIQGITAYFGGDWTPERDGEVFKQVTEHLAGQGFDLGEVKLIQHDEHPGEPASTAIAKSDLMNFIQIESTEVNDNPVTRRAIDGLEFGGLQIFVDAIR